MVEASFSQLLADFELPYDPVTHGWLLVLEQPEELDSTGPFHGQFSLRDILQHQLYEHVQRHDDFFEVVVALNDAEAVAAYLPASLLPPDIHDLLNQLAEPAT